MPTMSDTKKDPSRKLVWVVVRFFFNLAGMIISIDWHLCWNGRKSTNRFAILNSYIQFAKCHHLCYG